MCSAQASAPPTVLGISFDGFAISGIVIEMLHAAAVLRGDRLRVLCDLGYDITLGRTPDLGWGYLPEWARPVRVLGDKHPVGYTSEAVEAARERVVAGTPVVAAREFYETRRALTEALVGTFMRENVRILLVENGTLPDNPLFTEALCEAIADYGAATGLGKFVLWRDHDLMWSSEPHYHGTYPYPGIRRPTPGEHIHYAVTTDWMRRRLLAWAPDVTCHVIPCRFTIPLSAPDRSLRTAFGIPESAYLVARCTRVAPQKSIERDLRLLHQVQLRLQASGNARKVFLVVAGPTGEDPEEFAMPTSAPIPARPRSEAASGACVQGSARTSMHADLERGGVAEGAFVPACLLRRGARPRAGLRGHGQPAPGGKSGPAWAGHEARLRDATASPRANRARLAERSVEHC